MGVSSPGGGGSSSLRTCAIARLHEFGYWNPNLRGVDHHELILDNNFAISARNNLSLLPVNVSFQFVGDLKVVNNVTSPAIPVSAPIMRRVFTV